MDDWNNVPIPGAQVIFGSRTVVADSNGNFVMANVPRGATIEFRATTYRVVDTPAPQGGEVRMEPITLNLTVLDSQSGNPVKSPEARQLDGTLIRVGTESGDIAIAHPGRDAHFLVCAAAYKTSEQHTTQTHLSVKLDPDPAGKCPPEPTPSPSPSASPSTSSASPSVSPSPSASPTPSP